MTESVHGELRKWPYPVSYGKENEVSTDVLIIGGGIAGCHAAISAAKKGAKVAVVEKGAVLRSGAGGDGVDHWHLACTNPASRITPEEMVESLKSSLRRLWVRGVRQRHHRLRLLQGKLRRPSRYREDGHQGEGRGRPVRRSALQG